MVIFYTANQLRYVRITAARKVSTIVETDIDFIDIDCATQDAFRELQPSMAEALPEITDK